jgi:hypothetical protein
MCMEYIIQSMLLPLMSNAEATMQGTMMLSDKACGNISSVTESDFRSSLASLVWLSSYN